MVNCQDIVAEAALAFVLRMMTYAIETGSVRSSEFFTMEVADALIFERGRFLFSNLLLFEVVW